MTDQFSAGPRLADPVGDPARQATASLRGYAYQLYCSALAWVELAPSERLFIEISEDYAIVAGDALNAVQIKDTAASGNVTLNSISIKYAINSFVDLKLKNPQYNVKIRYASTSSIGIERRLEDRIEGGASLLYWRKAASGAAVLPLRELLDRIGLSDQAQAFISQRDDQALRDDFLKSIHWDCGQPDFAGVRAELEAALIRWGASKLSLPPSVSTTLVDQVIGHLLTLASTKGVHPLADQSLLKFAEQATQVSVSRAAFDQILNALSQQVGGLGQPVTTASTTVLEYLDDLPWPALLSPREAINGAALKLLRANGALFIVGATGMGKTLLARLVASAIGGSWAILDLRSLEDAEARNRLQFALTEIASFQPAGLIIDDVNDTGNPAIQRAMGRLAAALRRRDIPWIATSYRSHSTRLYSELGVSADSQLSVPDLTEDEVVGLVSATGADKAWGRPVYVASAFGHPRSFKR